MNTKLALISFALLLGTAAAPVRARQEDRADLMKQAQTLIDAKNWEGAEKLYRRVIQLDPKDKMGWLMRGFVRYQRKNLTGAIADDSSGLVAQALVADDAHLRAVAFTNRATAWNDLGEPLRGLVDVLVACKAEETFPQAWLARADIQYALGDLEQATICIERAKALNSALTRSFTVEGAKANALKHKPLDDKSSIEAAFAAAYQLEKDKKDAEAIAAYTEILETHPLTTGAWGNRGNLHFNARRDAEAFADYSTAITTAGLNADSENQARNLANRAGLYTRQGRIQEAVNDLELAVKVNPRDPRAAKLLKTAQEALASLPTPTLAPLDYIKALIANAEQFKGGLFDRNTNRDVAIRLLDQLREEEPNNAQAWYLRGVVEEITALRLIGRNEKALPFYEKAIALDPALGDAYFRRGKILRAGFSTSKADETQALADYDRAVELGVRDPQLYLERAKARNSAGNTDGALADLKQALAADPTNESYLRERVSILERRQQWREAIADRTALLARKTEPGELVRRAADYLELKDWAAALADLDRAIALQPDDGDWYIDRARAYRLKGDKARALADYTRARELDADYPVVSADLSDAPAAEKVRTSLAHLNKRVAKASEALIQSGTELNKAKRREEKARQRLARLVRGDKRTSAEILKEVSDDITIEVADEEDYTDRAIVYLSENKYDLAIADTTTALRFKPTFALALDIRGRAHELKQEWDAAFADYDAAVKADPRARYLADRGDVHYHRKNFALALDDYAAAAKSDPTAASYPFQEGNAQFMLGKYDEAIAAYDRALKLKPDFTQAASNREIALKKKG